jgi:HAD superfamily hydrolase (TIGR01549 family)
MSFSQEEGIEKPNPAIFQRTLEKMGYPGSLSDVLHVGDSYEE